MTQLFCRNALWNFQYALHTIKEEKQPSFSTTKAPSQLELEAKLRAEIVSPKPERWEGPEHQQKGSNLLFFCCENLGVRDTRSLLGINILDHQDELRVRLPDERCQDMVYADTCFLEQLKMKDGTLLLPVKASGICGRSKA